MIVTHSQHGAYWWSQFAVSRGHSPYDMCCEGLTKGLKHCCFLYGLTKQRAKGNKFAPTSRWAMRIFVTKTVYSPKKKFNVFILVSWLYYLENCKGCVVSNNTKYQFFLLFLSLVYGNMVNILFCRIPCQTIQSRTLWSSSLLLMFNPHITTNLRSKLSLMLFMKTHLKL